MLTKTRILRILFVISFVSIFSFLSAQSFAFQGVIINRSTNSPIPGCAVSLVHPVIGRSVLSISDNFGRFAFGNIPFRSEPYFIEIYWGNELIFRSILDVQLAIHQPLVIFL